jgi:hypothetical protein
MHDKKSDHYTSAQHYKDLDGNMRSFTFVDHDKKTKINTIMDTNKDQVARDLQDYRESLIEKILNLPVTACPSIFDDFKTRGNDALIWNEAMVRDKGVPLKQLMDIYTLISNKVELHSSRLSL